VIHIRLQVITEMVMDYVLCSLVNAYS